MNRQKTNAFLLLTFIAVLIFILAIQTSQLVLGQGTPVDLAKQGEVGADFGVDVIAGETIIQLMRFLLTCTAVFLPISLIYLLFTKRGRKELVVVIVNGIILFLFFSALRQIVPPDIVIAPTPTIPPEMDLGNPDDSLLSEEGGEEFVADPPEWSVWLGSLVVAVLIALVVIAVYLGFFRRKQDDRILEELAEEAQQAIDDIEAGGDLRQIIINCYRDMVRVVKKLRGIVRDEAMTPDEFQALLERKGLPSGPLQRLTRLFEDVRYGNHEPQHQEEQLAILCLREIVDVCQREERSQ